MLFRPDAVDLRLIGLYAGRVVYGVGLCMLVPLVVGLALGEYADAAGFGVGAGLAIITGRVAELTLYSRAPLSISRGLAAVALSWLLAPLFGGIPLLLSGHYASWLDAYFEAMSGFATIGLTVVNDLDHLARSVNLWRHGMQFLGGQGIVVVVLTIFASGAGQIASLYTGEGREEKILPNVIRTARFIWRVALTYAVIGISLLWLALLGTGLEAPTALYHAVNLFMAAFDTGGFATQSTSVGFYRSPVVEAVLLVIMVAGAFSFALHYQLWEGRHRELTRNLETRTLAVLIIGLWVIMAVGLTRTGTFEEWTSLFRHGFFHTVAAHTTTGLATVPGRLYVTDWGVLAPGMLVTAMALGGMAGSTAGGIKALRIGLVTKAIKADVRTVLLPEDAVVLEGYHSVSARVLRPSQIRAAAMALLLWLALYLAGALLGLFYGYDLTLSVFESVAAASSGGLSVGVVGPGLEWPLKVMYIAQMVTGRLEFVAIFALAGYVVAVVRGRA